MASISAKWIDDVIRLGPAPLLKRLGYKKTGRRFLKANTESISRIEFQGSTWNSGNQARFTLNVSLDFPSLEVSENAVNPNKPFTGTIAARIGHLMPVPHDRWWTISPDSDLAAIGSEVAAAIECLALPYLARVSTIQGLAEHGGCHPLIGKNPNLAVAGALAVLGKHSEAMAVFEAHTAPRSTLADYERAWLKRFGNAV